MSRAKELLEQATPLPWEVRNRDNELGAMVVSGVKDNGKRDKIVLFPGATEREWQVDHAALIVYAVNRLPAYEAAVDALERVMEHFDRETQMGSCQTCWLEADQPNDRCYEHAARAALARLRDEVPA